MAFYTRPSATFGSGAGRPTTLIVPNAYDPLKTYPLIIILHSYGLTGVDVVPRLAMDEAQNFDDGVFVLAPDGVNDGAGTNKHFAYGSAATKAAETTYLTGLRDSVVASWPVSWVGIWGYSNGGLKADELAAEYPAKFNMLLTLAGPDVLANSTASTGIEVPTVTIHGDSDTTVLTAGDAAAATLPGSLSTYGGYRSALATAAARHTRNGGSGTLGATGTGGAALDLVTAVAGAETTRQKYTTTRDYFWSIVGGNHSFSFTARRGETCFVHAKNNHR